MNHIQSLSNNISIASVALNHHANYRCLAFVMETVYAVNFSLRSDSALPELKKKILK